MSSDNETTAMSSDNEAGTMLLEGGGGAYKDRPEEGVDKVDGRDDVLLTQQSQEQGDVRESTRCCLSRRCITAWTFCAISVAIIVGAIAGALIAPAPDGVYDAETTSLKTIIQDPHAMFEQFNFVSSPFVFMFTQGVFNYIVQQILFFGKTMLNGTDALKRKLEAPPRLNKVSIAFQIVGLASTAFAFTRLIVAVQPWTTWNAWQTWTLLTTQHSAVVTLVVGLMTNGFTAVLFEEIDDPAEYDEAAVAKGLAVAGIIVGCPLWIALVSMGLPELLFVPPAAVLAARAVTFAVQLDDPDKTVWNALTFQDDSGARRNARGGNFASAITTTGPLLVLFLSLEWLLVGFLRVDAWLLAGATVLEVFLPLAAIFLIEAFFLDIDDVHPRLAAFVTAMCFIYIITIAVPASILFWEDGVSSLPGCAPSAFMGKQIKPFFKYTFFYPVKDVLDTTDLALSEDYTHSHKVILWLTQFVSFFT